MRSKSNKNGNRSRQQRKIYNRILELMAHTTRYAFKGASRLATDAGVSKSAISRLIHGQSSPSFVLLAALTRALEEHLDRMLDPRELISFDGSYPTPSVCQLAGCTGCLPAEAFDEEGNLKPEFRGIKPGQWSVRNVDVQNADAQAKPLQSKTPEQSTENPSKRRA